MYAKASHEMLDNTLTPQCDDWWVCAVGVVNFQPPPCRTAHSTIGPFPMHAIKSDWVEARRRAVINTVCPMRKCQTHATKQRNVKNFYISTQQALQLAIYTYWLAVFFSPPSIHKNTKYSKKRFDREQCCGGYSMRWRAVRGAAASDEMLLKSSTYIRVST